MQSDQHESAECCLPLSRRKGLLWLMEQRANSLWDGQAQKPLNVRYRLSEHADDAYDLEVLLRLRIKKQLQKHQQCSA